MKKRAIFLFVLLSALFSLASAQEAPEGESLLSLDEEAIEEHLSKPFGRLDFRQDYSRAEKAMQAFNMVTGLAISPALAAGAMSAWRWWKTPKEERASLPFHLRPWFFVVLLSVSLLFLLNGWLGSVFPLLEKPMQMVEQVETRVMALLALPFVVDILQGLFEEGGAAAAVSRELATAGFALPESGIGILLVGLFLVFAFFSVLLMTLATNVVIFISPFAFVDTLVRNVRALFLLALMGASLLHPALGALLSGLCLAVSLVVLRWTARIAEYGLTAVADVLFRRSSRMKLIELPLVGFGCRGLGRHARFAKVKVVVKPDGTYFLKHGKVRRKEPTTANFVLVKSVTRLWLAKFTDPADPSKIQRLVELPVRYYGHEEEIARLLNCPIEETASRAGVRAAVAWIRKTLNGDFQTV